MLMQRGEIVFCPIAHTHPIDMELPSIGDHAFWQTQDDPFLKFASRFALLKIDGWETSKGVAYEFEWAKTFLHPTAIEFIEPSEIA